MRGDKDIRKIALQVSIALSAGVFSIMPSVSAAPVLDHVVSGEVVVDQKTAPQVTDVTSTTRNNVIDWNDFSVAQGETVRFDKGDKVNNYLNLVSGANTSQINGAIKGGDNIYIVNPNGVIFGNTATVDVGSLYVSSRPITEVDYTNVDANGDMQPLVDTASSLSGDIVNMGAVQANSVFVEGNNVKFMDVAQVKTADGSAVNNNVTIQAEGAIRLGHRPADAAAPASVSAAGTMKLRSTKRLQGLSGTPGYRLTSGLGTTNFTTITNQTELEGINNTGLAGDYELGNSFSVTGEYTPVGNDNSDAFSGKFDGNYFTVSGITVSSDREATYGGLFGHTDGATIQNVGVSGVNITADYAGGIVGKAENTTLTNVFNAGGTVTPAQGDFNAGGIAGYINKTDIEVAYNHATVPYESGGGIVGTVINDAKKASEEAYVIKHAYDDTGNVIVGYMPYTDYLPNTVVDDVYTTGILIKTSFAPFENPETFFTSVGSKSVADYKEDKLATDEDVLKEIRGVKGLDISNSGSDNTMWRIYEGQTMPLLRPLLRKGVGAVTLTYKYTHGGSAVSNYGKDLTADDITYNGSYVNADTSSVSYGGTSGFSNFKSSEIKYSGDDVVRNVSTQALFYSNQTGYDLIGNNVTMAKKIVSVSGVSPDKIRMVYNGATDVTDEFIAAFNASSTGIVGDDTNYVTVGFTDGTNNTTKFSAKFINENASDQAKEINLTGGLTLSYNPNNSTAATIANNYDVDTSALDDVSVTGYIDRRTLELAVGDATISKVYDGTNEVELGDVPTNLFSLAGTEDITRGDKTSTSGKISGDNVTLKVSDVSENPPVYVDGATKKEDEYLAVKAGDKKVKFTGVELAGTAKDNYILKYAGDEITNSTVYLDGTIEKKEITFNDFSVVDKEGNVKTGSKVYDGSSAYTGISNKDKLQYGNGVGIVTRDKNAISFKLDGTDAYFADDDGEATKNVADATQIAYSAQAVTSNSTTNPLSNYKYKDANGEYHELGTGTIRVFGAGNIERRKVTLTLETATGIVKPYDQSEALPEGDYTTFGGEYVTYDANTAYKLVNDDTSVPDSDKDNASITITASYAQTKEEGAAGVYRNDDDVVVDDGKTVNFFVTMTGEDRYNYEISDGEYTYNAEVLSTNNPLFTGTGTITPLNLTPNFEVIEKTYNGTKAINDGDAHIYGTDTTPTNSNVGTVTGLTGDDVSLVYDIAKAEFSDPDASTALKTITYNGVYLDGGQAHNYQLVGGNSADGTGYIRKRTITAADIVPQFETISKTYDGETTIDDYASKLSKITVKNVTNGDLAFSVTSGAFLDANRKDGTDLQTDGVKYVISLTDANNLKNYTLGDGQDWNSLTLITKGYIERRNITPILENPILIKTYDASEKATDGNGTEITGNALVKFDGLLSDGTGNATTAEYADKNVGDYTGKVTYNLALTEANNVNNYKIVDGKGNEISKLLNQDGVINQRDLKLTFNPVTKVYDGYTGFNNSTLTSGTALYEFDDLQGSDNLTITPGKTGDNAFTDSANYNTSHVGADTVTYDNLVINGNEAGNYRLLNAAGKALGAGTIEGTYQTTGAGTISKYTLTATPDFKLIHVNKEYDGGIQVAYNRDSSNDAQKRYITTTTNIPYELVSAVYESSAVNSIDGQKVADGKAANNATFVIKLNSNDYNFNNIDDPNGIVLPDGYQYTLNTADYEGATITPRTINVTRGTVLSDNRYVAKPYDGDDGVEQNITRDYFNFGSGDVLKDDVEKVYLAYNDNELDGIKAKYNDEEAGIKTVTYTLVLAGDAAENYVLDKKSLDGPGLINKAKITIIPEMMVKTYNTTAVVGDGTELDDTVWSSDKLTFKGVNGESFTLSDTAFSKVSGVYDDAKVSWNGETVVTKGITYSGIADAFALMANDSNSIAKNYTLEGTDYATGTAYFANAGKINPKLLTVKQAWTPVTRVYNGGTDIEEVTALGSTDGKLLKVNDILQLTTEADLEGKTHNIAYTGKGSYDNQNRGDDHYLKITINDGSVSRKVGENDVYNYVIDNAAFNGQNLWSKDDNNQITVRMVHVAVDGEVRKVYDGEYTVEPEDISQVKITDSVFNADKKVGKVNDSITGLSYTDKNAAENISLNYTLQLTGDTYGNYILDNGGTSITNTNTGATQIYGAIDKRPVYVIGTNVTGINKTYNGSAALPDSFSTNGRFRLADADNNTKTGIVAGEEDIVLDVSGVKKASGYTSAHVNRNADGTYGNVNINFNGFKLMDTDSNGNTKDSINNYTLLADVSGSGTILPKSLTVAVKNAPVKEYDGTDAVTSTYVANTNINSSGLIGTDSANILIGKAYYDDANARVGDKGYTYELSLGNTDYSLTNGTVGKNGLTTTITGTDGTITPRMLTAFISGAVSKEYDGTDGVENAVANVNLSNRVISGDTIGLTAVAKYDNPNAGISEDSGELQNHVVTYTLNLTNSNYQLAEDIVTGTGTISRKGLTVVAMSAAVNSGEAMPKFSGTVEGLVASDSSLTGLFTFAPESTTTTSIPGSYGVYGWYSNRVSGNLGLNYTFAQADSNNMAFKVNYITNADNPDTKITPNSNIYHQISKDMNSGFGDNGAAAIEYKDKSGNVIARENINSGEINGTGLTIGGGAGDSSNPNKGMSNIGIAGGDIVNMEGADAASVANIELSGDGTTVNLEVFALNGEGQTSNGTAAADIVNNSNGKGANAAAEITNAADAANPLTVDNNAEGEIAIKNAGDTTGVNGSIAITKEGQTLLEENKDKQEEQEKEGEIAIKSSDGQNEDEIELTVEGEGVNVA